MEITKMSNKKNRKKQKRIQNNKRKKGQVQRQRPQKQPRRFPSPRATVWSGLPLVAPSALDNNPLPRVMLKLHHELHQASQRLPFAIWQDWLESTDAWLQVVGAIGELNATAQLPPEVQATYERVHQTYSQISAQGLPAAYRKMGQTFVALFRIMADHCPFVDLPTCVQHNFNPDFLGLAFIASLGYPRKWHNFFPDWASCTQAAAAILPGDPAEQVYVELAHGHVAATRLHNLNIRMPRAGDDDWQTWLQTILPYTSLPLLIDQVTSSTLLLALAARFPKWITRNGLVTFTWPLLEPDPVLSRITRITAHLYGLNGFYASKQVADFETAAQIQAAMEQISPDTLLLSDHPTNVYRTVVPPAEEMHVADGQEQPPPAGSPVTPVTQSTPSTAPSFSDLFNTRE